MYDKDEITGQIKKVRKQTEWSRFRTFMSFSVVTFFVILVLAAVIALFSYRATLDKSGWGPTLIGIANAIQIKIYNYIYKYVAKWLNDWENHEFPSEYSDSLITKLFLFQFINSYTSLYYIAFAKGYYEGC